MSILSNSPVNDFSYRTWIIDRYLIGEMTKVLGVALAVVLFPLLLERLLRLLDVLASHNGPFDLVLRILANLVPHYLGLALPAAFFLSMFLVIANLGDNSELDALQSAGLSLPRISRSFFWVGALLAIASLALNGYVQPYSRYAYRALLHAATTMDWDGRVPGGLFVYVDDNLTISADQTDPAGRELYGVFVYERRRVSEVVTTAVSGTLTPSVDGNRATLELENGRQMRVESNGRSAVINFHRLTVGRDIALNQSAFRERGNSERELTLNELWTKRNSPSTAVPHSRLDAELHARLVRALSLAVLPLLAIPMGMATKRSRRGSGILVACAFLVLYHYTVQFGESLAELDRIPAALALWLPCALFTGFCFFVFQQAIYRPGGNPLNSVLDRIETRIADLGQWRAGRR